MKIFDNLFRRHPVCTGLLCLIIISHLTEPKHLRTPILTMPSNLLHIFFFYVLGMLFYMMFVLPKVQQKNREKITWIVVAISIVALTFFMLFNPL